MQFLLIDNSNSRTKLTLADEQGMFGDIMRIETEDLNTESLSTHLSGLEFDAVMIASVVPQKAKLLAEFFSQKPCHFLAHDSNHGIQIDLTAPEQAGADRIANAIGVMSLYNPPAIVIDFGTAVTFDVINVGGVYQGGAIAPGLGAMNDYLCKKTALLPRIEMSEPGVAIGKSTIEAMQAGLVYGYRGLVKGIVEAISKELGCKPLVISTGGDGKMIAEGIEEIDQFSIQITLEGLRIAAINTFQS